MFNIFVMLRHIMIPVLGFDPHDTFDPLSLSLCLSLMLTLSISISLSHSLNSLLPLHIGDPTESFFLCWYPNPFLLFDPFQIHRS